MVKDINDSSFDSIIKEGKVLVDCYANWCGPCKMLAPIIEELSSEIDNYAFYKLDVDKNEEISRKYGIMSIPTLLIFENGELKNKLVGFKNKNELEDILK